MYNIDIFIVELINITTYKMCHFFKYKKLNKPCNVIQSVANGND